jgi:cytochrome c oxidase subunit 3
VSTQNAPPALWMPDSNSPLSRFLQRRSNLAVCFFVLSSLLLGTAGGASWLLVRYLGLSTDSQRLIFPPSFALSTLLLAAGSVMLHRASLFVRVERQRPFRRQLFLALGTGTAFVAVQTYGLISLIVQREGAIAVGLKQGAFAFALMHGVHFIVALMFVTFVMLRALADRYDHERSWGVTFCAWFWHALGAVWLAILGAFLVAATSVPAGA